MKLLPLELWSQILPKESKKKRMIKFFPAAREKEFNDLCGAQGKPFSKKYFISVFTVCAFSSFCYRKDVGDAQIRGKLVILCAKSFLHGAKANWNTTKLSDVPLTCFIVRDGMRRMK